MGSNTNQILTLANCIIGVSVLTMPFCFKQCGIALAILMLYFSSLITKLSCHYLLKSAITEKMKNFEMLAFRAFGPTGKMMVELCIIGFMLGSCVAFFVIMGDLAPTIVGPAFGIEHVSALRPSVLIGVAIFVVLPLGLLRNVDSLGSICTASIVFYMFLVLKVVAEAAGNLVSGNWFDDVAWWRPSGVLQCIPIFSMALSCQTQLFGIFDSLPNAPLERTNGVVRLAINMTTLFYIAVGFFGYTAYYNQSFSGNLMLSFSPTMFSQIMKMGFLLSIAVSFPLVIFPCRASIYSFLYSKIQYGYEGLSHSSHIPETTFQCITLAIITLSLVIGLLLPDIEVVIGLVGSTIGVFVCLIIPGMIFNSLSSKKNNEKLVAQCLVGIGLVIMVLGTYANLFATEEKIVKPILAHEEKAVIKLQPELNFNKKEVEKAIEKIQVQKEVKKEPEILVKNEPPIVAVKKGKKVIKAPAPEPVQPEPPKEIAEKPPEPVQPEPPKEMAENPPEPVHPEPPKEKAEKPQPAIPEPPKEIEKPPEPPKEVKKVSEIDKNEKIEESVLKNVEVKTKAETGPNVTNFRNLTASMAHGVPLPLVVKESSNVNEKREKRDADEKDCVQTEPELPELVKSARHLTNEKLVLEAQVKLPDARLEVGIPQKRDLKSLEANATREV